MKNAIKIFTLMFALVPSFAMASEKKDKCLGQAVIEVVSFSVNKGVTDTQIKLAAKRVTSSLNKLDGFKSRHFVQDKNGKWIDIVFWKNMQSALSASDLMMKNESALLFFSLINQKNMSMEYFCE